MSRSLFILFFVAVWSLVVGCNSSIRERHYFRATDTEGQTINYYRLTVTGSSMWSSARYVSGYFDEQAVNEYFSEFEQPTTLPVTATAVAKKDNDGKVEPLDVGLDERRLVLILSTNSDAIAQGIKSISDSAEINATLARIIGREHLTESAEADIETQMTKAGAAAIANTAQQVLTAVNVAAPDQAAAEKQFLLLANQIASFLEPGRSFTSLDEASTWLSSNRHRLLEGSR